MVSLPPHIWIQMNQDEYLRPTLNPHPCIHVASTALECFGAHRIIFGSTNPITMDQQLPGEFAIVPSSDWYTQYACRVMSELIAGEGVGQATDSMNAVFHTSALNVFRTVR
jgi:hypothetical protein